MPEFAPGNIFRNEALKKRIIDNVNPFKESQENFRKQPDVYYRMVDVAHRIAESMGGKVIGSGAQRIVIERPDGKVLGIYKYPKIYNETHLKKQFYTARILHTLFPQFYPKVYAAGLSSSFPKQLECVAPLLQKILLSMCFLLLLLKK